MLGSNLPYIEQGTGVPVVFVHGAISDFRYWEPQRLAFAKLYRFVAYNVRYHGTAPWPDQGEQYTWSGHAADLAALIRCLNAGPVHLVGLSMGGLLAILTAAEHPELVRSLTLAEAPIGALLEETPEGKALLDEQGQSFAAIVTAIKAGDAVQASKLLWAWATNQDAAAFEALPTALRQMLLDNARTVPLFFSMPPSGVSCATLGRVKVPTLVVRGEQTRRYYVVINEVIGRCIPGSRLVSIPQATHLMSYQNPDAFNEALLQFLALH